MNPIKVLFLGTPSFSRSILEACFNSASYQIEGVITKVDVQRGRGMKLHPSPVKCFALENNIPCYTPTSLIDVSWLKKIKVDVVIVVAYGKILPTPFLNLFDKKMFNIHTSLLPRWRGASPIQSSLLADDLKTGVSLQKLVEKMDAGPIIDQREIQMTDDLDSSDLSQKMQECGVDLLLSSLPRYLKGEIQPLEQDSKLVTYCKKIQKKDLKIDWSQPARSVFNKIRAYVINGGSYTYYKDQRLKVFRSAIDTNNGSPGCILNSGKQGLLVACGQGSLWLKEVQLLGRKRQAIKTFLLGTSMEEGEKLR